MGNAILVAIVAAFFLGAVTVAWACRRISADAAVETESETAFGITHRRPLTDS